MISISRGKEFWLSNRYKRLGVCITTTLVVLMLSFVQLFALTSCSGIESRQRPVITRLTATHRQKMDYNVGKSLYGSRTNTLFVLSSDNAQLDFYRDGKRIYRVGGLGTDKNNFIKLSDFALDPEGNVLVLDSFARIIKKFSASGMWLADMDLTGFIQPEKLCITPEGDLLVYDSAPKEISRLSGIDRRLMYAFGKFQIESAGNIGCNRDYLWINDSKGEQSLLFSSMGQYIRTMDYQMTMDKYNYLYAYQDNAIVIKDSDVRLPIGYQSSEIQLCSHGNDVLLIHENEVLFLRGEYEPGTITPSRDEDK